MGRVIRQDAIAIIVVALANCGSRASHRQRAGSSAGARRWAAGSVCRCRCPSLEVSVWSPRAASARARSGSAPVSRWLAVIEAPPLRLEGRASRAGDWRARASMRRGRLQLLRARPSGISQNGLSDASRSMPRPASNRVRYNVEPRRDCKEKAVPETVVLKRWRRGQNGWMRLWRRTLASGRVCFTWKCSNDVQSDVPPLKPLDAGTYGRVQSWPPAAVARARRDGMRRVCDARYRSSMESWTK
jgi:hypothetical protein